MGGLVGTFEGYIPGAQDLYYRGNNVVGFTGGVSYDAGQMTITYYDTYITGNFNMVGKTYLNLEGYCTNGNIGDLFYVADNSGKKLAAWNGRISTNENYSIAINISATQMSGTFRLYFKYLNGVIYRIWLS